jgi:hypothetical protein
VLDAEAACRRESLELLGGRSLDPTWRTSAQRGLTTSSHSRAIPALCYSTEGVTSRRFFASGCRPAGALSSSQWLPMRRSIRLSEGVRLQIDLVNSGLSEVERIDAANDQFHVPMLLLANGFERLMKAILCYRILHDEGGYPGIRSLLVRCTNARPNDLLTPRRWRGE